MVAGATVSVHTQQQRPAETTHHLSPCCGVPLVISGLPGPWGWARSGPLSPREGIETLGTACSRSAQIAHVHNSTFDEAFTKLAGSLGRGVCARVYGCMCMSSPPQT